MYASPVLLRDPVHFQPDGPPFTEGVSPLLIFFVTSFLMYLSAFAQLTALTWTSYSLPLV